MKKSIKQEGKVIGTVEIETKMVDIITGFTANPVKGQPDIPTTEKQMRHVITATVDGREKSKKILPLEDDVVHYAEQMEEELKVIVGPKKRSVSPHLKKLSAKGYK